MATVEEFLTPANNIQWTCPPGVRSVTFDVAGGAGGSANGPRAGGGRVTGRLRVTPGESYRIDVGTRGRDGTLDPLVQVGDGALPQSDTAGGGGSASRIIPWGGGRADSLVVAGGGGGRSSQGSYAAGGAGGGLTGGAGAAAGSITGGGGGTPTAGGAAGTGGGGTGHVAPQAGDFQGAGLGGSGATRVAFDRSGGGGGGGWHGGGGGDADTASSGGGRSGGGGGSSHTDPTLCTDVVHTQGVNDGDGWVVLEYTPRRGGRHLGLGRGSRIVG